MPYAKSRSKAFTSPVVGRSWQCCWCGAWLSMLLPFVFLSGSNVVLQCGCIRPRTAILFGRATAGLTVCECHIPLWAAIGVRLSTASPQRRRKTIASQCLNQTALYGLFVSILHAAQRWSFSYSAILSMR